jgi:hypothetical protein
MWNHVWKKLERKATANPDLFCELFRELNASLATPKSIEVLADITDSPAQAKSAFRKVKPRHLKGEKALVSFLEWVSDVLADLGGEALSNEYFSLLDAFLTHFSLRYELRRPCLLCPTLTGVFARHFSNLKLVANGDPHLSTLLGEFETSIRDLRSDRSETRLKTCIQKQVNLLEALGRNCPGVTGTEIGPICDQVGSWPHNALKASLKSVYGFASDYPGIRHGGTPASAIRALEIRDLVAVAIALTGFATYVTSPYDGELVYLGARHE